VPTSRPDDDYDDEPRRDDDRPWRRRRDDDRPPAKSGGAGRILLILLLVGGGLVLCCGGCGLVVYFASGRQVTMIDGSRTKSPQGGTTSVRVKFRVGGDLPGGFVRGDYTFYFKSGSRTSDTALEISGRNGMEVERLFMTPELVGETGPVEFWVEKRDRDGRSSQVSPTYTIP
jgi:hypothetical protein